MYVLYSDDQSFVHAMVSKVASEVAQQEQCPALASLLQHFDRPQLYRCLFFLMVHFHKSFRNWVLSGGDIGLQPICSYKIARFLNILSNVIVPRFLVDERIGLDDFEYNIKVEYIRS